MASSTSQHQDHDYAFEAQRYAMESGAKLNTIAFNYAMEVNKALFEIGQKTLRDYTSLQHRLVQCRSPEEFVTTQAEIVEKTANEYKEGFDRIANLSSEIGRKATKAMQEAEDSMRNMAKQNVGSQHQGQTRPGQFSAQK